MKAGVVVALLLVLLIGANAAGETRPSRSRKLQQAEPQPQAAAAPQQWYPPPAAQACYKITEAQMTTGKLCVSQLIRTNVTKVICNEFKPECTQTVTETHMLVPTGNAQTNPAEFNLSNEACCKLLGYRTSGSGSIHMTGDNSAAKSTCWNGREWSVDNWWTTLVCCT